jgi:hypothetical protein
VFDIASVQRNSDLVWGRHEELALWRHGELAPSLS